MSLFLRSVNLALGLLANDPVRIALTFTSFICNSHFEKNLHSFRRSKSWEEKNKQTVWKSEIGTCHRCLYIISSVKVGGSPGCRRPRPVGPQADEPEGKPRPLRQYDSPFIFVCRFTFLSLVLPPATAQSQLLTRLLCVCQTT